MNILLLSAYDAASHRSWYRSLQKNISQHRWTVLSLPPRFFNWRIRGNSLTWAYDESLKNISTFDCLIATSMTDLSSLRGMRPELSRLPTLLYFHENQFAYPASKHQHQSVEPQMVQLYSAICADRLVFNSRYNQDSFFEGVERLLKKLPDCVPAGVVSGLRAKSECIAVPISEDLVLEGVRSSSPSKIRLVWNHRWEYDKGPELLLELIMRLPESLPIQFHIVGQKFRVVPKEFDIIYDVLRARSWLGKWGYVDSEQEYRQLLSNSDIVLSTAKHDFQGLAVLEAVALGCIPILPNALVYPEWFAREYLYSLSEPVVENLCAHTEGLVNRIQNEGMLASPSVEPFFWPQLKVKYENVISKLVGGEPIPCG